MTISKTFFVNKEQLSYKTYSINTSKRPTLLFLHGAGLADKNRIQYIAEFLLSKNISSFSFDFSGHGECTGKLEESSLQKRVTEARKATEFLDPNKEITLVGSSMGAHIAIQLLQYMKVKNLILFCPAVYAKEAELVQFNQGFSEIIREKDSWKTSTCFVILHSFKKNLLIIIGQEDKVIPEEIVNTLMENSIRTKSKAVIQIPTADHQLHRFIQANPFIKHKVLSSISRLFN